VGLVGAGLAAAQPPKTEPVKPASAVTLAEAARSVDPLSTLLSEARTAHGRLRDYSCTFTRQERINGSLSGEQVGEMGVRVSPVGVHVRFALPSTIAGMEVSYTPSSRDGKFRYRAPLGAGQKVAMRLDLDDHKFMAENRHQVKDWGIGPMIETVATATAREKALNNPVEVYASDYLFAKHNVTRYEIYLRRPHALRYAAKLVVFLDKETKLPMRFEAYDEPKPGADVGELLEAYSFTDLRMNTGLGESTFDR
jgi:hypothetical protein